MTALAHSRHNDSSIFLIHVLRQRQLEEFDVLLLGMEFLDVVNEQDVVIGRASRVEIYERLLTHRIVHVYVFNNRDELALQRRSALCDYCPLHFGTSAAGHVHAGESYEKAAARELKEELGIEGPLELIQKEYYTEDPRGIMKFITIFRTTHDGDLPFDPNEVESVQWLPLERVHAMIEAGEPFTPPARVHAEAIFHKIKRFDGRRIFSGAPGGT